MKNKKSPPLKAKTKSIKAKPSKRKPAVSKASKPPPSTNPRSKAQRVSSSQLAARPDDLELVPGSLPARNELIVVGIGASAGGLEALQVLIPTLPHTNNITYVLAQHLDPKHPSMLVPLLSRHSEMTILELQHETVPMPGTLYITPPDRNVLYENGRLTLSKPVSGSMGPKPSIDIFFSSLGEQLSDGAVGIILSGTGSDGAHGVKAIKANGGFVIAQDPDSAKYDGMPRMAIETGCVDLILPAPEIGRELPGILVYPTRIPLLTQVDGAIQALQALYAQLHQSTGCDFSEYKQNTIHRRIGRRMAVHKMTNLTEYLELAETSPAELEALYKDIIISVTSFFRDSEAFQVLKDVLGQLIDTKAENDSLRIWVPGCASGEEAYSIAMSVAELLAQKKRSLKVNVFATDIDTDALSRARKGLYPEAAIHEVDKAIVKKFFTRSENYYRVSKSIREMVVFSRQDLVKDPPFSHLDLVSCRNVLIYFSPNLQQRLMPMFHYVLNPNGYMFLGKSESTGQFVDLFAPIEKKAKLFRRRGGGRTRRIQVGGLPHQQYKSSSIGNLPPPKEVPLVQIVNQIVAEAYGHPAVVTDSLLNVIHVRGEVSQYLSLAQGEAGLNVLAMVRPDLRAQLRAMLMKCAREQIPVMTKDLIVSIGKDEEQAIRLHLRPVKGFTRSTGCILISFETVVKARIVRTSKKTTKGLINDRIHELENELKATQEHLQTTVEELETANEELQSLNEELQSANEELQSSNEELETSNEELQSTNEELTTLNEEIQERSAELSVMNSDLENIQHATGLAMLVVDKSCRLTRFTPAAAGIFQVSDEHLGHAITTIPTYFDIPHLREDVVAVIDMEQAKSREIQHADMTYLFQVMPYQCDQRTMGAVLIFIDKTGDKRAEQALRDSELRFRQITENIEEVFWLTEPNCEKIQYVSPAYERIWGRPCETLYDRGLGWVDAIHPDYRVAVQELVYLKMNKGEFHQEYKIIRPDGSERWIWHRTFPVKDDLGSIAKIVGVAQDITARKQAEATSHEKEQRFRTVFNSTFQLMALLRPTGHVLEMNQTMLDFFGMRIQDVVGKPLWEGTLGDVDQSLKRQLHHAIDSVASGGAFVKFKEKFVRENGEMVPLDFSIRGVKGDNKRVNALVMEASFVRARIDHDNQ